MSTCLFRADFLVAVLVGVVEAVPAQEGPHGLLRSPVGRPRAQVRSPALPLHAGESRTGDRAQFVRNAGTSEPQNLRLGNIPA